MIDYAPRVVDAELDELIVGLPAVSIDGPKGVGKTATAQRRAQTVFALDRSEARELLSAYPDRLNTVAGPVLIDEWQRMPQVWDIVRRSVDNGAHLGRFLLTGSASPSTAPTHSGAGRILSIRMRPMTLVERGVSHPTVSLKELLAGDAQQIDGSAELDLRGYTEEILASGFPGIRGLPMRTRRAQLDGYLSRIVEHDFPEQGHLVRRPATLRAWLTAYAAATASTTSYRTILEAATPGETDKPAKTTTIGYRDVLTQLWLLDPVPGWIPTRNPFNRLAQAPKHHLADPALAARLLGATADSLLSGDPVKPQLRDGVFLGALFESLVAMTVRVYAQAAEATVSHLRTGSGEHEIDFIVERSDHRVVACEVKLGAAVDGNDGKHLRWLRDQLGDDLIDMVIINTGTFAYRRKDGIAVIPLALLAP